MEANNNNNNNNYVLTFLKELQQDIKIVQRDVGELRGKMYSVDKLGEGYDYVYSMCKLLGVNYSEISQQLLLLKQSQEMMGKTIGEHSERLKELQKADSANVISIRELHHEIKKVILHTDQLNQTFAPFEDLLKLLLVCKQNSIKILVAAIGGVLAVAAVSFFAMFHAMIGFFVNTM